MGGLETTDSDEDHIQREPPRDHEDRDDHRPSHARHLHRATRLFWAHQEAKTSKFRARHEDVSFACIVGTPRTPGQFRTKEVVIEC